jgi:hypothetical protein
MTTRTFTALCDGCQRPGGFGVPLRIDLKSRLALCPACMGKSFNRPTLEQVREITQEMRKPSAAPPEGYSIWCTKASDIKPALPFRLMGSAIAYHPWTGLWLKLATLDAERVKMTDLTYVAVPTKAL